MRQAGQLQRDPPPACNDGPPRLLFDRRRQPRKRAMPPTIVKLHDYDLTDFSNVSAQYVFEKFLFVVVLNVVHLIRFCDDEAFRALYAEAGFILNDSRFLSRIVSIAKG